MTLYVNGRGVGRKDNIQLMPLVAAGAIHFGREADAFFDEIAMFDRPLTPGEVKALYESPASIKGSASVTK